MDGQTVWSVSEATEFIRTLLDADDVLGDIWIEGEVSNLTNARSGHLYFTLKDAGAQIKCVMWRSDARCLAFDLAHGDAVRAHGRVSVYPAGGAYQLYTDMVLPVGRGDLHQQFEALKAKLLEAGLFEQARKKPLPRFPNRIGVATSADAAALQDILNVLAQRYPLARVLLAPTLVQGNEAPRQIIRALAALDGRDDIDVIILARGGGSLEDLWAFNDERVAWAIYGCRHPVITGVGHETDFTIADFVADVRAPTPSAAAAVATPDVSDLAGRLAALGQQLDGRMADRLGTLRWRLTAASRALQALSPRNKLLNLAQQLDDLQGRIDRAAAGRLQHYSNQLRVLERALGVVNPLATLARGYAIVRRHDSGVIVTNPAQVAPADLLEVRVHRGRFGVAVTDV